MKAYLIAQTKINEEALLDFNEYLLEAQKNTKDTDYLPEIAGRLCYMSFGKGRKTNEEYLDHIKKVKHGSVLEHTSFSILFEGLDKTITHEMVRHRAGFAYSQLSDRYVDKELSNHIIPRELRGDFFIKKIAPLIEHSRKIYNETIKEMEYLYKNELRGTNLRKKAKQTARKFLLQCNETKILVTGNARAWRHFLMLRGNPAADTAIIEVAIESWKLLKKAAPNIFSDIYQDENGNLVVERPNA